MNTEGYIITETKESIIREKRYPNGTRVRNIFPKKYDVVRRDNAIKDTVKILMNHM